MKTSKIVFFSSLILFIFSCKKEEPAAKTNNPVPSSGDSVYHVSKSTLLQLVNNVRITGCTCGATVMPPVPALIWNDALATAADNHSIDMLDHNFFSHTGSDGSSAGDRITAAGYTWNAYGENIAKGYADENAVMQGWLASEGHCKNIMNGVLNEMGAARENDYWTQDFGSK